MFCFSGWRFWSQSASGRALIFFPQAPGFAAAVARVTAGLNRGQIVRACASACERPKNKIASARSADSFQAVTQGVVVPAFESSFFALPFPGFDQVFQTP